MSTVAASTPWLPRTVYAFLSLSMSHFVDAIPSSHRGTSFPDATSTSDRACKCSRGVSSVMRVVSRPVCPQRAVSAFIASTDNTHVCHSWQWRGRPSRLNSGRLREPKACGVGNQIATPQIHQDGWYERCAVRDGVPVHERRAA